MVENLEARTISFPERNYQLVVLGNNALQLAIDPKPLPQAEIINIADKRKEVRAFKHEFYEKATDRQIEDDIISYLGEYRLEVSEFDYELDIVGDKLVDPASRESMVVKVRRAIENRKKDGLNISREEAELRGLITIEGERKKQSAGKGLRQKSLVWFSPPGEERDGYGKYGFAYVGTEENGKFKMTAIRLENPQMPDFNNASQALWGKGGYERAEDFLMSPQIIDIDKKKVKEFIHGNFEIKDEATKRVFEMVRNNLGRAIEDFKTVVRGGVEQEVHDAIHVMENMALRMKGIYEQELKTGNVVFLSGRQIPNFSAAMAMVEYTASPPSVRGSCGVSGKSESNDIFRSIKTNADGSATNSTRDFEFDQPGPCRLCERDVPCGPCKICEACNDKIDATEFSATE